MGWLNYYRLLEKYGGDIKKATKKEFKQAVAANPNDPFTALSIASKKFVDNHPELRLCHDKDGTCEEDHCRCHK